MARPVHFDATAAFTDPGKRFEKLGEQSILWSMDTGILPQMDELDPENLGLAPRAQRLVTESVIERLIARQRYIVRRKRDLVLVNSIFAIVLLAAVSFLTVDSTARAHFMESDLRLISSIWLVLAILICFATTWHIREYGAELSAIDDAIFKNSLALKLLTQALEEDSASC